MIRIADIAVNDIVTVAGLMGGSFAGKVTGIDPTDRGGVLDIEVDDADSPTGKTAAWCKITQVQKIVKWSNYTK
jgi:hypothetical protein